MVELPEQDGWELLVSQFGDFSAPAGDPQTVLIARSHDVGSARAVAADAAGGSQFLDGHPAPEMGEHRPKTGRAAFGRLHLGEERGADAPTRKRLHRAPSAAASEAAVVRVMIPWGR